MNISNKNSSPFNDWQYTILNVEQFKRALMKFSKDLKKKQTA